MARWRQSEDLTAYAEGVTSSLALMDAGDRESAIAWLAWVRTHLDQGRSALRAPTLPADLQRDDVSLLSTLGVDFDTWHAWRSHRTDIARADYSDSDGAEY